MTFTSVWSRGRSPTIQWRVEEDLGVDLRQLPPVNERQRVAYGNRWDNLPHGNLGRKTWRTLEPASAVVGLRTL